MKPGDAVILANGDKGIVNARFFAPDGHGFFYTKADGDVEHATLNDVIPAAYFEHRRASGLPLVQRSNEEIYDLLTEINGRLRRLVD